MSHFHQFNSSYPLHAQNDYTLVCTTRTTLNRTSPSMAVPPRPQLFNVHLLKTQYSDFFNKEHQEQCNQEPFTPPLVAFCTVGDPGGNWRPLGFLVMIKGK